MMRNRGWSRVFARVLIVVDPATGGHRNYCQADKSNWVKLLSWVLISAGMAGASARALTLRLCAFRGGHAAGSAECRRWN